MICRFKRVGEEERGKQTSFQQDDSVLKHIIFIEICTVITSAHYSVWT